ncbi:MAG: RnfH family protein [Pseudomonadota bacterium]
MADIRVEIVVGNRARQLLRVQDVPVGTTVIEAIRATDLAAHFPEIDIAGAPVGIFGRRVAHDQVLKAGDRIEIYRPLVVDPREARRRRADRERQAD